MLAADRRKKAVAMRLSGASYSQIGASLGVSRQCAFTTVRRALEVTRRLTTEVAEELKAIDLARIDAILLALWAKRGERAVADTILRALARRAAMLGLDAPIKADFTLARFSTEEIEAEAQRLEAEGKAEIRALAAAGVAGAADALAVIDGEVVDGTAERAAESAEQAAESEHHGATGEGGGVEDED